MRSLAFLFVGLAACGAVDSFNDAAVNNGSDSGHPADASTIGTANVTTYDFLSPPGTPLAGVSVVVDSADGTQRDEQTTDASGNATVNVHVGDSITALYNLQGEILNLTFAAVKPSDHIVYGFPVSIGSTGVATGSATVNIADVGATQYEVSAACTQTWFSGATSTTITFNNGCGATTPILITALDNTNQVMDWARVAGTPTNQNVNVPAPAWQQPLTFTLDANGLAAEVTNVYFQLADYLTAQGYGPSLNYSSDVSNGVLSSGAGSLRFVRASEPYTVQAQLTSDPTLYGTQTFYGQPAATATSYTLSNPALLPWLGVETYDSSSNTLGITKQGSGSYETQLYQLAWTRSGDAGSSFYDWLVIAPPDTTSFTLPTLTGADAYANPAPTDQIQSYIQSMSIHIPGVSGYDQLRTKELGEILPIGTGAVDGTAVSISRSQNAGFVARPRGIHLGLPGLQ